MRVTILAKVILEFNQLAFHLCAWFFIRTKAIFADHLLMKLLEDLVAIHAPSGEEFRMKEFLADYVRKHSPQWTQKPMVYSEGLQDALVLVFGEPRTAIFAHTDSIGFTVRYQNQLVPIGGPDVKSGYRLTGSDSLGPIECELEVDEENQLYYQFPRAIMRGTSLVFKPNFRLKNGYIQSPRLDNRLGVYAALKVAETLEDGIIVFSTYEEHGGGSVPGLLDFIMKKHPIEQVLIADITWCTEGIVHGEGVAISLRDRNIPRKLFLDKVLRLAEESGIKYQLEVEGSGSSDGREVQQSPYALDWVFIGAPEDHVHSPDEKVSVKDVQSMIDMHKYLMKTL
jgi:putative aminopeptidase FrvX